MIFQPDYRLPFISEADFSTAIEDLEQQLQTYCHYGYFKGEDGKPIYYEYYPVENAVASVVVVHGMSEFTKKYSELTWYLLHQGYNVFLYDQRGHGLSHRDTDRPELIHLSSFDQLVEDLHCYIEQVVCPASSAPLFLYAHSMGGAVGILYLAKYPKRFCRAVLTSPLLAPRMNDLPAWPFLLGVSIRRKFAGDLKKFRLSKEYVPCKPYTHVPGDSPGRIQRCLWHRDNERRYQSTPMTLGCVYHNLKLRRRMLKGDLAAAIQTPTLMLCAEHDTFVKTRPQAQFAALCPPITREVIQGANHALLTDEQSVLEKTVTRVLEFFQGYYIRCQQGMQ